MKNRIGCVGLFLLLTCLASAAQSKFKDQLQPGLNTRRDVEAVLGKPVRTLIANVLEYAAPDGASHLVVQYRPGVEVIDLIQVDLSQPNSRADVLQSLGLAQQPEASGVKEGRFTEYFGGGKYLVLGYASQDPASGVNLVSYYSRELYTQTIPALGPASSAPTPSAPAVAAPAVSAPPSLSGARAAVSTYPPASPAGAATAPPALSTDADTEFRIRLLSPISTRVNKKGDKITAQVTSPQGFTAGTLEGQIREAKSSGKLKGKSSLNFTFETLHLGGNVIPVRSSVKSVANSKGAPDVDEEGRVIRKQNNLAKAAVATGIGALLGAALGGAQGAMIGAGVGAAASLIFIQVATEGADVSFAPGSEFILLLRAQAPQK
jgi:hypothetical protein